MLSHAQAVTAIAEEFGVPPPAANSDGDAVFELADSMFLAVRSIPGTGGDGGMVAWTKVAEANAAPEAAERFLRLHLARLGRADRNGDASGAVATRGDDGSLILFARLRPVDENEWLGKAADLLNEAEAMRKHMTQPGAGRAAGGMMDLFRR
jgi:hypothetical protein